MLPGYPSKLEQIHYQVYVAILPEKWWSHDFQSRDSHVATGNRLRHWKKKKNTREETGDICRFYCCSYIFLTGNDLGVMGVFFPENRDKTDEVCAQIAGSLKFGSLGLY